MYFHIVTSAFYLPWHKMLKFEGCSRLKQISIIAGTAQIQKTILLGMARILRKALEISTVFSFIVLLCVSSIIVIN